ncbi:transmembrane protein 52 [Ornithorhynchus anatinus]|uniref:Transmembrane protein 52 n=1 Tax=Ornithorhynchus anatinus TaxID=9258 RepID=A0A6I8P1S6_ORNAN|nr:transmembrane protein 52 [Ornithorhynchus anatinus]
MGWGSGPRCPACSLLLLPPAPLLLLLQVGLSRSETGCGRTEQCPPSTSWTNLWYVWLILLTVFLLLLCGITASCIKFCCRKKRPPAQAFPRRPYDLTVIALDNDSTIHSTVTSYSSLQYPLAPPLPLPFAELDRGPVSPPAYSLYALELPPSYDEAIKMAKPDFGALPPHKLSPGPSEPGLGQGPSPDPMPPDPQPSQP